MRTIRPCSIDGCDKDVVALGYCELHYRRFKKYGDPNHISRLAPFTYSHCTVDGCDRPHLSSGFCNRHYIRNKKYGDPLICQFECADDGEPLRWVEDVALMSSTNDCILYPFAKAKGYGQLFVEGTKWGAHRYVCERTNGPSPSKDMHAAHECGNPSCVNPRHLKWKTPYENERDKWRHGTRGFGELSTCTKLSEQQVLEIRGMHGTHAEIAKQFGVSRENITAIRNRKTWPHI